MALMATVALSLCWIGGGTTGRSSVVAPHTGATASSLAAPRQADERSVEQGVTCEHEHKIVQTGMQEIFRAFRGSVSPNSVEVLVNLDGRIRALLESRPRYRPCLGDSDIYESQWARMGVKLGYWEELSYSGVLLCKAHERDPDSAWRKYTLFSTVFGTTPYHGLGVMPNIEAAFKYASEFPDGPYIKPTLLTIAGFHKDLFMVLRDGNRDYKYDCYKPYIDDTAIADQRARAKQIALEYYAKVLEIDPSNESAKTLLDEVERETVKAWSFCAD